MKLKKNPFGPTRFVAFQNKSTVKKARRERPVKMEQISD